MRRTLPPTLRLAPRNGAGVAALVIGVAALVMVLTFLFFPLGGLLGIVAVALGIIGLRRAAAGRAFNRGQALAGLLCGALALLLALAFAVRIRSFVYDHQGDIVRLDRCLTGAGSDAAVIDCARRFADQVEREDRAVRGT